MKKTLVALLCASALTVGTLGFVGCAKEDNSDLVIAYLSGGRGETYVEELVEAFKETTYVQEWLEKNNKESLKVKIVKGGGATIEDSVLNSINSGTTPSIMFLNKNMQNKLTESFISAKQLVDLSDLLDDNVYGETTALQDKLVDGLLNNYSAQPYGDGKTYALPAFYSPLGLWYDASRFYDDGEGTADTDGYTSVGSGANAGKYELPHTWDEFWDLGDYLNSQNSQNKNVSATAPSLFTYPTAGYFDGYIFAAIAGIAGEEKFLDALGYEDGIWLDTEVKAALETVVQLRDYLEPTTVAQANGENFQNNQQAVIGKADGSAKGTALFIPNGDWLPSEMAESTPAGFEWGFMPLPKTDEGNGAVATNLEDPAKDILAVSHKRYQIEDCFRVMKTNLDGRPINHRLPERIRAHFLICYTGLLVYRLLEARLDDHETHVTVKNLVTTLKNINVTCIHDVEYMALYNGSKALDALVSLTTLNLDRMHYKPKELNRMIKKLLK